MKASSVDQKPAADGKPAADMAHAWEEFVVVQVYPAPGTTATSAVWGRVIRRSVQWVR